MNLIDKEQLKENLIKNMLFVKWAVNTIVIIFVSLNAESGIELKNIPINADDLASVINNNISISSVANGYGNSLHDLSTVNLQSDDQTGKCIFCHTQNSGEDNDVLWNMSNPSDSFKSDTDHTVLVSTGSLKCLSCHDGATAVNTLPNGIAGFTTASTITTPNSFNSLDTVFEGVSYQSQDLGNNHPVGIIYDEGKKGLNAIADLKIAKLEAGTNKVTCASCHEPHNQTNGSFLTLSNIGSALCLDCHNK